MPSDCCVAVTTTHPQASLHLVKVQMCSYETLTPILSPCLP